MGQATVDLPDPLQNSTASAGPSADDLLAQLAGEEIDRLLAEAESERSAWPREGRTAGFGPDPNQQAAYPDPSAAGDATSLGAPTAADGETGGHSPLDPHLDTSGAPPTPIGEADVEELDARISKEFDSLFTELNADAPSTSPAKPGAPATANVSAAKDAPAATAPAALPLAPLSSDPIAQAAELEQLVMGKTLLDALAPADGPSVPTERRNPLLLLLRPLEWLNAPLLACSDAVREAVGKVAILTVVNALAVLLYVIFLRKH